MLSCEQQQRVAVSRALVNHPRMILADRSTAALASHRGRQVMEPFRNVACEHGAGMLQFFCRLGVNDILHAIRGMGQRDGLPMNSTT